MTRTALCVAVAVALCGCGGDERPASAGSAAEPPAGLKVWVAQGCGSCHTLEKAGAVGDIGPSLDSALAGRSRAQVMDAIVNPSFSGSMMPEDFGTRLDAAELRVLADFLIRR